MDEKIECYIFDIVFVICEFDSYQLGCLKFLISYGGLFWVSINLALVVKVQVFFNCCGYVIFEDVCNVCFDVMCYCLGLIYEVEVENIIQEDLINKIFDIVEVF